MNGSIFRKKSIDRINSPESLNDYVKVTNPSVWIILIGTLILIVGALVFGANGTVDTNINVVVEVSGGNMTAYVDEAEIEKISSEMSVKINGTDYSIGSIAERPIKSTEVDEYVLHKGDLELSQWVYPIAIDGDLKDGVYGGTITIEKISPISYVFN